MYAQQDFAHERHGTAYIVCVTLGDVCGRVLLQVVLNWHTGFGGGSRRTANQFLSSERAVIYRMGCDHRLPREVLADAMQEDGYDEGITAAVRGSEF
jgi:hypothetical protein